jgi:hydrogenase expression/formation protein HypC
MKVTKIENRFKGMASAYGVSRPVRLELVSDVKTGDYVLVHAGFAVSILDAAEAVARQQLLQEFLTVETEDD